MSDDHHIGVSIERDDCIARSSGHSATAGTLVVQCDSHLGGGSRHSHTGVAGTSDRHLSLASERTRRKPSGRPHQNVSVRHGRQASRHDSSQSLQEGYSHSISITTKTWKFEPGRATFFSATPHNQCRRFDHNPLPLLPAHMSCERPVGGSRHTSLSSDPVVGLWK